MTTLTPPQVLSLQRLKDEDAYFCEHMIVIDNRHSKSQSFKFNKAQELVDGAVTGRDISVKAGQMGSTTYWLARFFKATLLIPNTTSIVLTYEEPLTQRLLRRVKNWYDRMPQETTTDKGVLKKWKRHHNSDNELSFPEINSTFFIGTAKAYVFGRGEPINRFLGSECAFWPDADKIIRPVEDRCPLGSGEMSLESTPNGDDNRFYELVEEALTDPMSIWTLHQVPWWLEDEYRLGRNSGIKGAEQGRIKYYTEEETALILRAGWDDDESIDRIRWRRLKIRSAKELFWQEFFEDIVSCFLTTGAAYFDAEQVNRLRASIRPPDSTWNNVQIWYPPDEDWENPNYIISVDPGQGKITSSVATVWRINHDTDIPWDIRHEATLAGLYDSVTFAPMVIKLAEYYRGAKIAPERNGHGQAFCAQVKEYQNLYYQTDVVSEVPTQVIGWATTGAPRINGRGTKSYMIDELSTLLPGLICHDENIISQIARVKVTAEGKIEMPKQDDYFDSAAIMAATRSSAQGHISRGLVFVKKGWTNM